MSRRLVALVLFLSVPAGAAERIPWTTDRAEAFARAGASRGPLLLLFSGPECGERSLPGERLRMDKAPDAAKLFEAKAKQNLEASMRR